MSFETISIAYLTLNLFIYVGIILLWKFNFKDYNRSIQTVPKVSILVACRNEANNIPQLMKSLAHLDYPKDKLEILIGNDSSKDNTLELLHNYKLRNLQIFNIDVSINNLKGKMNTLAHLAQKASGDFLFFTDADMTHHPQWIRGLLNGWDKKTGVVAGFSSVHKNSLFSNLEHTDYSLGQGLMKVTSDIDLPLFASGNNMMISCEAYAATGGFENMDFHITEDVLLLKKVIKLGFKVKTVFTPDSVATTFTSENLRSVILQRKRWMAGFDLMPSWVKISSIIKVFYLPVNLWLLWNSTLLGIFYLSIKIVLNNLFSYSINQKIKGFQSFMATSLFEFYELIIYLPALVLHLFSKSNNWKERKF